jgi:hypothetical protein
LYTLRILVEGFLIVVFAIKLCCKLRVAFYKRTRLVYTNLAYFTLRAQGIGYISYACEPRGRSTRNKLKYILNNNFLFKLSEIL